ncbi:hypothetical protein GIB67_006538 [Kingdonia uniflora]|uniref:Ankyrin repeat domain-containing protein n=1 Tax=Kingdonia uniflora TaxID=39325 RepID=A0A7J7LEP2_9MAGN|nr:hypothetical protein GIB67_006538 [Kingdonia uniflora]
MLRGRPMTKKPTLAQDIAKLTKRFDWLVETLGTGAFFPPHQPPPLGVQKHPSREGSVAARNDNFDNPFASLKIEYETRNVDEIGIRAKGKDPTTLSIDQPRDPRIETSSGNIPQSLTTSRGVPGVVSTDTASVVPAKFYFLAWASRQQALAHEAQGPHRQNLLPDPDQTRLRQRQRPLGSPLLPPRHLYVTTWQDDDYGLDFEDKQRPQPRRKGKGTDIEALAKAIAEQTHDVHLNVPEFDGIVSLMLTPLLSGWIKLSGCSTTRNMGIQNRKSWHQKCDCPALAKKVGLVVDGMRDSVIAIVPRVLQDKDEEDEMHTTFVPYALLEITNLLVFRSFTFLAIPVVPTIRVLVTFTKFEELQPLDEFCTPPSSPDATGRESPAVGRSSDKSSWLPWVKHHNRQIPSMTFGPSISRVEDIQDPFAIPADYTWITVEAKKKKMQEKKSGKSKKGRA